MLEMSHDELERSVAANRVRTEMEREAVVNNRHQRRKASRLSRASGNGQNHKAEQLEANGSIVSNQSVGKQKDSRLVINFAVGANGDFDIYTDEKLSGEETVARLFEAFANLIRQCSLEFNRQLKEDGT